MVRCIGIRDGVRPSQSHHDHFAPAPASFRLGFGIPALGGDLSRCMSLPPYTMEAGTGGISTTKKNIKPVQNSKLPFYILPGNSLLHFFI